MNLCALLGLLIICDIVVCLHDYYAGVFNKNDLLVAQDTLYKEKAWFHTATANYVRYFKCPISYYRVQDRLGVAQGPRIEKLKGGLGQNFLLLRFSSVYNNPISVNIYIACANKEIGKNEPLYTRAPFTRAATTTTDVSSGKTEGSSTSKTGDTSGGSTTSHVASTSKAGEATTASAGAITNSTTVAPGKPTPETNITTAPTAPSKPTTKKI